MVVCVVMQRASRHASQAIRDKTRHNQVASNGKESHHRRNPRERGVPARQASTACSGPPCTSTFSGVGLWWGIGGLRGDLWEPCRKDRQLLSTRISSRKHSGSSNGSVASADRCEMSLSVSSRPIACAVVHVSARTGGGDKAREAR